MSEKHDIGLGTIHKPELEEGDSRVGYTAYVWYKGNHSLFNCFWLTNSFPILKSRSLLEMNDALSLSNIIHLCFVPYREDNMYLSTLLLQNTKFIHKRTMHLKDFTSL